MTVMSDAPPALTDRFLSAVALAAEIHGEERRTGTEIPYLAHLLVVCGLALEDGGDEDQAIAAMLHDAVEDGGGQAMLGRIRRGFGPRVAAIVESCSDNVESDPAEPWIERKRRYLAHLPRVTDDGVLRVALADKVHNARSIVRDYREEGHTLWERFTPRTAHEQLWYYGGLLAFFGRRRPGPLTEDLRRAVSELAWLVARDDAQRRLRRRVWLDCDLHMGQAPPGWIQVLTAAEAIELLGEFVVHELSLPPGSEADAVVDWLIEEETADRDPWPVERLVFHGEDAAAEIERFAETIASRSAVAGAKSRGT
jgi:HD domain